MVVIIRVEARAEIIKVMSMGEVWGGSAVSGTICGKERQHMLTLNIDAREGR